MTAARRGRWQFTLKQLLLGVSAVALLLGLYYWTMTVDVDEVPPGTPIAEHYFGFIAPQSYFPSLTEENIRTRNIARVSGRFFGNGAHLSADLYLVEAGKITEISGLSVGASPNRLGPGFGEYLRITFALGDIDTPVGRCSFLGSIGQTRGGGSSSLCPHKVTAAAHALSPGRVSHGQPRVIYAEGETQPIITQGMSIESFAATNSGRYLAVTLRLE